MDKKKIISSDTQRNNRIPPNQREIDHMPQLDYRGEPYINISKYTLTLTGNVESEIVLTIADIEKLPQIEVFSDIHCVTGWSLLNNNWTGVSTRTLFQLAKPMENTSHVLLHCEDKYTTNITLDDFLSDDALFALTLDGYPIQREHGHPLRLIIPKLYLWKSAKWVNKVEFMTKDKKGYWEQRGYHNHGDPWKEERYG